MDVLTDPARRFLAATAPEHTAIQAEMAELADDWGFREHVHTAVSNA